MCFDKNIHQKFIRFVYNASRICKFGDFEISTQGSGEGRKRKKNRNSVRMKQCREQTLRIYLWLIYTYAADSHSSNILKININFTGKVFCAQACWTWNSKNVCFEWYRQQRIVEKDKKSKISTESKSSP